MVTLEDHREKKGVNVEREKRERERERERENIFRHILVFFPFLGSVVEK